MMNYPKNFETPWSRVPIVLDDAVIPPLNSSMEHGLDYYVPTPVGGSSAQI